MTRPVEHATTVDDASVMTPFTGRFLAGSVTFAINGLRSGRLAWDQMGLGGLPSHHTALVSSTAVLTPTVSLPLLHSPATPPSACIRLALRKTLQTILWVVELRNVLNLTAHEPVPPYCRWLDGRPRGAGGDASGRQGGCHHSFSTIAASICSWSVLPEEL